MMTRASAGRVVIVRVGAEAGEVETLVVALHGVSFLAIFY
jgi:hypothetical protein